MPQNKPLHDEMPVGPASRTPIPDPTALTTENLNREIAALKELVFLKINLLDSVNTEKFHSIQVQFKERDTRAEQTAKDNKSAIDAAFNAAKEAVSKSEGTTVKQIDQFDGKINDVKDRLTRIEGASVGKGESTQQYNWAIGLTVAVVLAVIGFYMGSRSTPIAASSSEPRVVYVPVPAGQTAPMPALVPAPAK
jgi:hypothetical protein